ncbi:hypothetical protein NDU88_009516 [Pleurodeles waltl]|uniref:Peptidase A2 domain-containing protein n=1 Tax=Pleurodeles waltl TaxID=8319 RepID=A0AAV7RZX8_PLEWA|nr:hypothetical protein NDU88_009516 [Pleurodeles waltl]
MRVRIPSVVPVITFLSIAQLKTISQRVSSISNAARVNAKKINVRCVISEDMGNGGDNNEYVLVVKEATTQTNKVVMDLDIDVTIEGVMVKLLVDTGACITHYCVTREVL